MPLLHPLPPQTPECNDFIFGVLNQMTLLSLCSLDMVFIHTFARYATNRNTFMCLNSTNCLIFCDWLWYVFIGLGCNVLVYVTVDHYTFLNFCLADLFGRQQLLVYIARWLGDFVCFLLSFMHYFTAWPCVGNIWLINKWFSFSVYLQINNTKNVGF